MNEHASFGEWVRRRRKALDLTQQALAGRVNCSKVTIVKIESDQRRPSRQMAELLADALQVAAGERVAFIDAARGARPVARLSPPASAPAGRPGAALPEPPTPLVGREHELDEIERLLRDPACRLLTLTGPGGVGKTRLALEAARRLRASAGFVPLAPVQAAASVAPAIAAALAFALDGRHPAERQLLDYLRDKPLLLVLDNFEHLMEAAGFLAEVVAWAPGVKLLVTSRERLRLRGEWLLEVQGLPVAAESAAVTLFVQAARRARPDFELTAAERPAVARICHLVDGLPLAIELAAAWAGALSCAEIADEIARNLDFLGAALRDLPERQRSLRAVFDHSWRLLAADEQGVLRRLSALGGAFRRATAEQAADATLATLSALVDKSLLRRAPGDRYDLHELVRQFAVERLDAAPAERTATLARLAGHYAGQAAAWERRLKSAEQLAALAEIEADFDIVRGVWGWLIDQGAVEALARCFYSVWFFCEVRGRSAEGEALFGAAAGALRALPAGAARDVALGRALVYQAWFGLYRGQTEAAQALLEESLELLRAGADHGALADALFTQGSGHMLGGRYEAAARSLEEALALAQKLGDQGRLALAGMALGTLRLVQSQAPEAYAALSEALTHARAAGDPYHLAACLGALGAAAGYTGRREEAQRLLEESLALYRPYRNRLRVAKSYSQLGMLALAQGDLARAEALLRESEAAHRDVGERSGLAVALNQLGRVLAVQDRRSEAWRAYAEAARCAAELQVPYPWLDALLGLAEIAAAAGVAGERLGAPLAALRAHPACQGELKTRAETLIARLGSEAPADVSATLNDLTQALLELPTPGQAWGAFGLLS